MIRTSLGALAALAIAAMVGALALVAQPGGVEAQSQSASRAFQRTWAAPGGQVRVTITASNYGAFGQVVETLPDGFTFVSASLPDTQIEQEGQVVRFNLFGDSSFNYVVTVAAGEGRYTFNGVVRNADRAGTQLSPATPSSASARRRPRRQRRHPHRSPRQRPRRNPRKHQPLSQTATPVPTDPPTPSPTPAADGDRDSATPSPDPTRRTPDAHGHTRSPQPRRRQNPPPHPRRR